MIIPIRCFTCGEIIADKWQPFIKEINSLKSKDETEVKDELDINTIDLNSPLKKSIEGTALDKLGLTKMCCRRMMLTNVSLISYIN